MVRPHSALAAYCFETARTALGLDRAIASKVRAAPLGCFRPCSQPCRVRTETPSSTANCDCESPVLLRASIAGDSTMWPLPAFRSRMDCRISSPISRLASKAAISAWLRRLDFEGTANLLELCDRNVFHVTLCKHGDEHDLALL